MTTLQLNGIDYKSENASFLLERLVIAEDQKAFEVLYYRYFTILCMQVYGVVQCRYQAEEIVSDVFLKIWNNKKKIAINTNIVAYLSTSVRNQAIDYLRKNKKHKKVDYPETFPRISQSINPEDEYIFNEGAAQIEAIISALPPKGQYIFRLSRDKGMKYQEIADFLGISIKTVETHMRRALIFIRAQLRKHKLM